MILVSRQKNCSSANERRLDIANQGDTIGEARENLREALELVFETESAQEVSERLRQEVYVTQVEVGFG